MTAAWCSGEFHSPNERRASAVGTPPLQAVETCPDDAFLLSGRDISAVFDKIPPFVFRPKI